MFFVTVLFFIDEFIIEISKSCFLMMVVSIDSAVVEKEKVLTRLGNSLNTLLFAVQFRSKNSLHEP